MQEDKNKSLTNDMELSIEQVLISVFNKIWKERKFILKFIIVFFFIGFIAAITSPIIYESQTTFVPQTSDQNSSANKGYAQLASLAGINLNAESVSSLDPRDITAKGSSFDGFITSKSLALKGEIHLPFM